MSKNLHRLVLRFWVRGTGYHYPPRTTSTKPVPVFLATIACGVAIALGFLTVDFTADRAFVVC